jgi:hypothetical protein
MRTRLLHTSQKQQLTINTEDEIALLPASQRLAMTNNMKTENLKVVELTTQETKTIEGGGIIKLIIDGFKGIFKPQL